MTDTSSVQAYQFEAIGFVPSRADLDRLGGEHESRMAQSLFAAFASRFAVFGFTGLEEAYITEDDGQGDTDIKFFVCIRVIGHSDLVLNEEPPADLVSLFDGLCCAVCCDVKGQRVLNPEDWELVSINEPAGQSA